MYVSDNTTSSSPSITVEDLAQAIVIDVVDVGAKIINLSMASSHSLLTKQLSHTYDYAGQKTLGNFTKRNDTSFAALFVTGTIALLWSVFPEAKAEEEVVYSIVASSLQKRGSIIYPLAKC